MKIQLYPKPNGHNEDRGLTYEDIRSGYWALYMDIICDCGKEQALSNLNAGHCIRCGKNLIK